MRPHLRPPLLKEIPRIIDLSRSLYPERPEPADLWQQAAGGTTAHPYLIAAEPSSGCLIGYGCARPEPGAWRIHLGVETGRRRQGVGSQLLDRLLHALQEQQATVARVRVREPHPEAGPETLAFLERRGFAPYERMLFLAQDLTRLPEPSDEPVRRAEAAGVTFTTIDQELEQNPAVLQEIYDLYAATTVDIPTAGPVIPPAYEAYVRSLEEPLRLPAGFVLARVNGACVGMSYGAAMAEAPDWLGHRYTGVRREYRGRGIARALKTLVTRFARQQGYARVTTATLEVNRGMRAVNESLGFAVAYSELRLSRDHRP